MLEESGLTIVERLWPRWGMSGIRSRRIEELCGIPQSGNSNIEVWKLSLQVIVMSAGFDDAGATENPVSLQALPSWAYPEVC